MYWYHVHAWYQRKSEEAIVFSGTGITDVFEQSYRLWELNPGRLERQAVLLTPEPFLQSQHNVFRVHSHYSMHLNFILSSFIHGDGEQTHIDKHCTI